MVCALRFPSTLYLVATLRDIYDVAYTHGARPHSTRRANRERVPQLTSARLLDGRNAIVLQLRARRSSIHLTEWAVRACIRLKFIKTTERLEQFWKWTWKAARRISIGRVDGERKGCTRKSEERKKEEARGNERETKRRNKGEGKRRSERRKKARAKSLMRATIQCVERRPRAECSRPPRLPAFINLFPSPLASFVLSPDNMPPRERPVRRNPSVFA